MSIEQASMDFAQGRLMNQVQTSVLAKGLDQARQQGADLMKLIQAGNVTQQVATDPALGTKVNILA